MPLCGISALLADRAVSTAGKDEDNPDNTAAVTAEA